MSGYWPKTDTSPDIKYERVTQYKKMAKEIRWAVELGRADILLETALMSTYLTLLSRGNIEQVFHMFGYLKANPKRKIFFKPQHPTIDERSFSAHDWYDLYWDVQYSIPEVAPTPRMNMVSTHCFCVQ